jgi:N-sulfoglucosamine sulfohydrolase
MKQIISLLTRVIVLVSAQVQAASAAKPNFLLIVADDLNWHDLGFTGNREIPTPNLDKLRAEGVWLRNMFNSAATCSPTRHALHTGLDCVRSGAYPNHTRAPLSP